MIAKRLYKKRVTNLQKHVTVSSTSKSRKTFPSLPLEIVEYFTKWWGWLCLPAPPLPPLLLLLLLDDKVTFERWFRNDDVHMIEDFGATLMSAQRWRQSMRAKTAYLTPPHSLTDTVYVIHMYKDVLESFYRYFSIDFVIYYFFSEIDLLWLHKPTLSTTGATEIASINLINQLIWCDE